MELLLLRLPSFIIPTYRALLSEPYHHGFFAAYAGLMFGYHLSGSHRVAKLCASVVPAESVICLAACTQALLPSVIRLNF